MKTGRKQLPYQSPTTGKTIDGLSRMKDGRWRIIGTQTRFSEPDEQKAIDRFRMLTGQAGADDLVNGVPLIEWQSGSKERALWAYVRQQILERPVWVAQQVGIEQIGWLNDLKKPVEPTFAELESNWDLFYKKSPEQRRRVKHAWKDFKAVTKVTRVGEITAKVCVEYRENVYARENSPKGQDNVFSRIRRLFTFAKSRAIEGCESAIEVLKLLKPNDTTTSYNPQPIEISDFQKLLAKSEGETKAMILLMVNGGFYCQEVVRLKWSEIVDGCIVTHRAKEGKVIRACVLWKETIKALEAVKRKGEYIFYSYKGEPLGVKGAEKRFRVLRDLAEVSKDVTSSHLRDGAATAMAEGNVNNQLQDILMGHQSGIADRYIKRKPTMVAPASLQIHKVYFGE